jgi:serine/threonine protein kinase
MTGPEPSSATHGTEFRLLRPMPVRAGAPVTVGSTNHEAWDTQVRRLFPPRDTAPENLPVVHGIQLGHFAIESRIARGGMGTVFLARDTRLDRVVALKVLSNEQLRDPAAVQRFQNEGRAAARLDHENIARVHFLGEDRGVHFIAFEYIRGTTVREEIAAKGLLSADEAVNYTLQACEALKNIESAGLVHRDIKPSNLIVTSSGRVKLVDLGLARNLDPEADQELTVTGTTLGTFDYISPEQARNPRNVDIRSDIYSLGCTLFHMLTGSPPYPHGTNIEKLLQHSTGQPRDPAELNPRISPRLSLVVQRMMAPNVNDRYPNPQALIDDLIQLAEGLGLRATAPEGTIWRKPLYRSSSPRWEENRGWIIALALIAIVAVAGDDVYRWYQSFSLTQTLASLNTESTSAARLPVDGFGAGRSTQPSESAAPRTAAVVGTPRVEGTSVAALPDRTVVRSPSNKVLANSGFAPISVAQVEAEPTTVDTVPLTAAADLVRSPFTVGQTLVDAGDSGGVTVATGTSVASATNPGTTVVTPGTQSADTVVAVPAQGPFRLRLAGGTDGGRFQTLEAACHAAKTGSVIEIDWDGPLPTPQKPVIIDNKRLRIAAAAGKRPLLSFVPSESQLGPAAVCAIEVNGGALELYDVDISLAVDPTVFSDEWVVLSLVRAREVLLQRVTVSVKNPQRRPTLMIARNMPTSGPAKMMPAAQVVPELELIIRDCLFRGDAGFLMDRSLEPANVRISDSAIAVANDFLLVRGADPIEMEGEIRTEPVLHCEFDHVSVVTGQSLLRVETEAVRDVPTVRVDTRNSILSATGSGLPFVLLEGHQDSDELLQRLRWNGSWNVYAYRGDKACVVRGLWPQAGDAWTFETFADWQDSALLDSEWDFSRESVASEAVLRWEQAGAQDFAAITIEDFALAESSGLGGNPARGTAGDSSDRGFRPQISELLPKPPASSSKATPVDVQASAETTPMRDNSLAVE